MIEVMVPGWRPLTLNTVMLDYNGTLAVDGELLDGVAERLRQLADTCRVIVLTADTHSSARRALDDLPVEIQIIDPGSEAMSKRFALDASGTMQTAFIGNGANDEKAVAAAAVGIVIVGPEGAFGPTLQAADLVVSTPLDALDLLLHPTRLVAGLRR